MNRKITSVIFLSATCNAGMACPVCDRQQPAFLRGITHGAGPQSNWDWVIVAVMSLITVLTLFYSVKFLVKPGENSKTHIKQSVLNQIQ